MDDSQNVKKWDIQDYELENLTPLKALRILVECFYVAQGGRFEHREGTEEKEPVDKDSFHQILDVVKSAFKEVGGDFIYPTKETLRKVVELLAAKAEVWGTPPEIIAHHKSQILKVLDYLDD